MCYDDPMFRLENRVENLEWLIDLLFGRMADDGLLSLNLSRITPEQWKRARTVLGIPAAKAGDRIECLLYGQWLPATVTRVLDDVMIFFRYAVVGEDQDEHPIPMMQEGRSWRRMPE